MPLDPNPWSGVSGSNPVPPGAPTIGEGRYALVGKIAEGGMAGVYRAWDNHLSVWRAIKVLLPEFAERRSLRTRFENEAHTMANLDHPHVIRVFDVATREALPYIVMELAEGGTLIGWCETHGCMPPRLACDAMRQVALGVQAAHDAGVVHRDVKPHNVLITDEGVCKVTDFGIARVMVGDGMTRTGSTMGTIGYMAPEQRADAKGVDARADVYSLGAVLYKLLTNTVVTDLFLVEHEPELLETVPEPLHEVLLRACFHDRARRFPDAARFAQTLEEVALLLPADPPDTPALPVPPEDQPLDGPLSERAFPEIGPIFGPPDPDAIAADPAGDSATPSASPLLPYRMPRFDRTPSVMDRRDDTSLYDTDPAMPVLPDEPRWVGVDGTVETDAPAQPVVSDEETTEPGASGVWVRVLAASAVSAWLFLALFTALGTWETRGQAQVEGEVRAELYAVLSQEQGVLGELARSGVDEASLARMTTLHRVWQEAKEEPTRLRAAAQYAGAIDTAAAGLDNVDPSSTSVVRTRNVRQAYQTWRTAHDAWVSTARSPQGRLATGLGLAPRP